MMLIGKSYKYLIVGKHGNYVSLKSLYLNFVVYLIFFSLFSMQIRLHFYIVTFEPDRLIMLMRGKKKERSKQHPF